MIKYLLSLLILIFGLVFSVGAGGVFGQETSPPADTIVTGVRVTSTAQRARLIVDLGAQTPFSFVSLIEPKRIAVDVQASSFAGNTSGNAAGMGLVSDFSVAQISKDRLRTVLTLTESAQVQQAYVLAAFEGQPARLVVDIIQASDEVFSQIAAADSAAMNANAEMGVALTEQGDLPGSSQIEASSRPLILIDPGHGGVDGGATSESGVREKEVTLLFAKELQNVLIASGRFDVALTRDDDRFMRLEERIQLARDNKADLLISVHADSFDDTTIRGASVYIRDEQATDVLDKVLAENENKVDLLAGFVLEAEEPAVIDILVDLMRREMRRQSFLAANAIVEQLQPSVRVRRFPLRRANFFVLQSPDIPAILVELGFMSNNSDVENLTSGAWRERVSEAVARGVASFFDGTPK